MNAPQKGDADHVLRSLASQLPASCQLFDGQITGAGRDPLWLEMEFSVAPEFAHRLGVQGGILTSLLESVIHAAARWGCGVSGRQPEPDIVTLEIKTSYLSAGAPGVLRGRGELALLGGSVAFAEGVLRGVNNQVVARASATLRLRKPDH